MQTNCLFCHSSLGHNEIVESFQTGRSLAFDGARGRLWVVCQRCLRWNLAPLELRWEAIEECERVYAGTTLRKGTENIGLARAEDGTQLIRIGRPLLPEFAAWRYSDRLVRRHRTRQRIGRISLAGGVGCQVLTFASALAAFTPPVAVSAAAVAVWLGVSGIDFADRRRVRGGRYTSVALPGAATRLRVRSADARVLRVLDDGEAGWKIRLPHTRGVAELRGPEAVFAAGLVLPRVTWEGATPALVAQAVARITAAGGPERLFASIARENRGRYGTIIDPAALFAAEISAHQASESEHLDEQLRLLEMQWRAAEEIAAIADDLLVPEPVRSRLGAMKEARPPDV